MEIDYNDPAVIAIQNTTPNAGCTIDGQFYDVRNLLATIDRLTAERYEARAATAAAYERAADSIQTLANQLWPDGKRTELADHIRALTTEPGTTALAEIVKQAVGAETRACPLDEWHEDMGDCVWWCWHDGRWLGEPAMIGNPLDSAWPGYHTHFTPHPAFPARIDQRREAE